MIKTIIYHEFSIVLTKLGEISIQVSYPCGHSHNHYTCLLLSFYRGNLATSEKNMKRNIHSKIWNLLPIWWEFYVMLDPANNSYSNPLTWFTINIFSILYFFVSFFFIYLLISVIVLVSSWFNSSLTVTDKVIRGQI